jgi:wyosine [tRNA(Phe)-imidazoG37] synthetase (radical SAM superfamily)
MTALLDSMPIVFGPVPSRRLGKSLGINNIRPKVCTYSCVYCQLGKTSENTITRQFFYQPSDILKEISLLKRMGIPIAVLTNASMLWLKDVRQDLLNADYVSLKVDAVKDDLWRKIDRPHKDLELSAILNGIRDFAEAFKGTIVTETMLVNSVDYANEFERIARFLTDLKKLDRSYIGVPIRPPAETWVKPAREEVLNVVFQVFSEKLGADKVEYLIGYEGNAFAFTGNVEEDLLGIMAVHPMRAEAVEEFLRKANSCWQIIEKLLREGKIVELEFEGNRYYMRKLA